MSEMLTSDKLDYKSMDYAHPTYRFNRILPQSGSQNVTITTAGGQESVFEIPVSAFNLAQSELSYDFSIPALATKYIYRMKDVQSEIRQIQLYTRSGVYLGDLNNADKYTKIVMKTDTELEEFLTYDKQQSATTVATSLGVSSCLHPPVLSGETSDDNVALGIALTVQVSGVAATGILTFGNGQPDMRTIFAIGDIINVATTAKQLSGNVLAVGAATVTIGFFTGDLANAAITHLIRTRPNNNLVEQKRYDNSVLYDKSREPQYLESGVLSSALEGKVKMDLSKYKNTIFSYDKDLYLGEIILMRIIWNASTSIYFTGDSVNNPETAPVAAVGNVSITNLQLYLATERNQTIVNQLRQKVESGTMSVMIPYVHSYKTNLTGNASVSLRFNRGHGVRLQKIYHSVFNQTESKNTAYDNSNLTAATQLPGAKITSFYTMLNNNRLQEFDVVTANYEDFMILKPSLKSSVIQNSNISAYNWSWIENFIENLSPEDRKNLPYNNLRVGLDLTLEQKWDIYLTIPGGPYNHHTFAVVQKMLTVGPSGISVL